MSETTVGKILEEIWISVNDKGLEERRLTIKKARKTRTLFELLVATILSQNTNSRNSSRAFRNLLKRKLIHPKSIIEASMDEIRDSIKVAGLYNRKSIKLKELAQIFMEKDIEGELKQLLKEDVNHARGYLLNLPAIGRKTADIVLLFHYGKPVMPVDTHIARISKRLGFVSSKADYEEIRKVLEEALEHDEEKLLTMHLALISFGRKICSARNPKCKMCPVKPYCGHYRKIIS
ncbi:MAG: endonuclease III [Thermoproteales archaeon]|nr:endonuclease III [Thermoproteales archaeon]